MSVYICSKSSVASSVRMSLRSKAYFALLWQSRGSALVNSGTSRRLKHHLKQLSSSRPAIGAFFVWTVRLLTIIVAACIMLRVTNIVYIRAWRVEYSKPKIVLNARTKSVVFKQLLVKFVQQNIRKKSVCCKSKISPRTT